MLGAEAGGARVEIVGLWAGEAGEETRPSAPAVDALRKARATALFTSLFDRGPFLVGAPPMEERTPAPELAEGGRGGGGGA